MSLSQKYNVPRETIQKMVNDGVISCSWPMYEEVYALFQTLKRTTKKTKGEIYCEIAHQKKISERTVQYIISRF